jgi:hypothetical protein
VAKTMSLVFATIAWLLFAYNPSTVQRTFAIPVEYRNVPKELEVDETAINETRVTLSGTEPAFRFLEPATLKISVDMADAQPGTKIVSVIPKKNFVVPNNLSVYRIEHPTINVFLNRRITRISQESSSGSSK